ncbi:MAG: peptidylprolyl isomerase [Alphaproteobacteria bacterium]|nr:peptidylprolyl isomerase [Alphaproteobacteria bacterium]
MTIENEDFIKVDYTETVDGFVISTTNKDVALENDIYDEKVEYGPQLIILGSGDLVEGFKEELIGKEIGDSGSVEAPPEKAFGTRDPNNVELIPLNKFKQEKPELGMRVSIEGKMGTITRVVGRKVRVDYNHPLADKTINYDYSIVEKIEDRQNKLESLVSLFAKVDLEVGITDEDVAEISSPWELSYYKEWPMIKRGVAEMAMRLLNLKEVRYIEKHTLEPRVTSQVVSPPPKPEIPEDKDINAVAEESKSEGLETADEQTE